MINKFLGAKKKKKKKKTLLHLIKRRKGLVVLCKQKYYTHCPPSSLGDWLVGWLISVHNNIFVSTDLIVFYFHNLLSPQRERERERELEVTRKWQMGYKELDVSKLETA